MPIRFDHTIIPAKVARAEGVTLQYAEPPCGAGA
jgi:hypothetical protein